MVKLTQVDDETAARFERAAPANSAAARDYSDFDSESDSEFEDNFDLENETLYDRIVALKDVVPPRQRTQIVSAVESAMSVASSAFSKGGALLWGVTSSILLLGVPLSLAILSETQLQEMEKEMSLQKSAQEVLAPGSEGAFSGEKATA